MVGLLSPGRIVSSDSNSTRETRSPSSAVKVLMEMNPGISDGEVVHPRRPLRVLLLVFRAKARAEDGDDHCVRSRADFDDLALENLQRLLDKRIVFKIVLVEWHGSRFFLGWLGCRRGRWFRGRGGVAAFAGAAATGAGGAGVSTTAGTRWAGARL